MSNYIVRFSLKQRVEHFVTMTTFAMLCLTGLPQKFYTTGWAASLVGFFGGIDNTRWIHRWFGILLAVSTVVHFASGISAILSPRAIPRAASALASRFALCCRSQKVQAVLAPDSSSQ